MPTFILTDNCGGCRWWSNECCWNPTSKHNGDVMPDHKVCSQWLMRIVTVISDPNYKGHGTNG